MYPQVVHNTTHNMACETQTEQDVDNQNDKKKGENEEESQEGSRVENFKDRVKDASKAVVAGTFYAAQGAATVAKEVACVVVEDMIFGLFR